MVKQLALEFLSGVNKNSAGFLIAYLNKLPIEELDLLLLIGSSGGTNTWARSAYSALKNLPSRIHLTTCGCGTVESSAVTLFCAGSKRICMPFTRFQFHQATWQINELLDLRRATEIASVLRSDDLLHASAIASAIGKPTQEIAALIEHGAIWTAEEAKNNGLVQHITETRERLLEGRIVERIFNVDG